MLGPYRVEGVLGQGGMGVVYAGIDALGRRAAIKTIGRLRSHAHMIAFRAEVHALRRVQHPGIVRFLEEGLADVVPWYAMDLIDGPTLATFNRGLQSLRAGPALSLTHSTLDALIERREGIRAELPPASKEPRALPKQALAPDPLLQIVTLYRHICAALGHVHRRGLIHRDLKPSNVLVAEGGRPVLVDFGLVSQAGLIGGRETIVSDSGGFLGSPAYMAPEQIRGDSVDARTDLYALGCMLFESLTGRTPFVAASMWDMLDSHLGSTPPSPRDLVDGLPEPLIELLSKLLAKAPHDRLGHADDCERALSRMGGHLAVDYATSERDHTSIYFYRPRPAGRAAVLDQLFSHLDRSNLRQGRFVLVKGESGSGKTFLVTELARRGRRGRHLIVSGECPPIGYREGNEERSSAPLAPIRTLLQLVADRCRAGGPQNTERLLGPRCRVLVRYEPTLEHVPGFEEYPEPPETTPAAARERVLSAVRDTVLALCAEQSVVWIIDDLQWADELSLDLLASMAPGVLKELGLLLAGTCRSDEITPAVAAMIDRASPDVVGLGALETEDVAMMTADMLAVDRAPASLVNYLATRGHGNPFFVAEYLRAAASAGVLVHSEGRWRIDPTNSWPLSGAQNDGVDLPVPASIKDLIARRIQTLPRSARQVLEAASVLRPDLDLEILVSVMKDTESTLESVALLREKQILSGDVGRLQFVHDQIAEFVYSGLPDSIRRELHEVAAQVLERTLDADPAPRHRTVAHHWSKAGHPGRSAAHLHQAAKRARESWANEDAARLYKEAVDLAKAASTEDRLAVLVPAQEGLGDLLTLTGESEAAAASYLQVVPLVSEPLDVGRLHRKRAHALTDRRRYDDAIAALAASEAALDSCQTRTQVWWQEWIEVQNALIWVRYWTAKPDGLNALVPLVDRVRGPVEKNGTSSQRTRLPYMLSLAALRRDRFRSVEGLEHARACASAAVKSDHLLTSAESRFHLGFVLATGDHPAEAERILTEVVADANRLRHAHLEVRAQAYLSVAQRRLRSPTARASAERTLSLATKNAMPLYVAVGYANRGSFDLAAGHIEQAARDLEMALTLWRNSNPVYPFKWLAGWPLFRTQRERRAPFDEVRSLLEELLDVTQQVPPEDLTQACRSITAPASGATPKSQSLLAQVDEGCVTNALY
jgi:eukaryotic-like serine/threonine-protein kinase